MRPGYLNLSSPKEPSFKPDAKAILLMLLFYLLKPNLIIEKGCLM
ncbi:hypothetical protein JOD18_003836 [Gracilibacillus alcaliphilus]|nr:hypothetical protein [Gracilibacillus alcaliphilus]